ncbi:putative protein phosphatase 2C 55 [Iris pallida]|uniref:Uncharacterized protein n=1 Tax=Iris pallida TaxID=29817 RepID=A0AAX6GCQ1_IRIPA|nr:putative protein phosphatase 2C 55 [Iris pallida]
MPSSNFPKKKVLHSLAGILTNQGSSSVLGNSGFVHSSPFSTFTNRLHPLRTSDIRAALSLIGTIPLPSVIGQTGIMSACTSLSGGAELGARQLENLSGSSGQVANATASSAELCYGSRTVDYCRRASGSLKNREPWGNNMVYKCFWSNATSTGWKLCPSLDLLIREFHLSCSAPYSVGAAPNVSLDCSSREEQLESPGPSSEECVLLFFADILALAVIIAISSRMIALGSSSLRSPNSFHFHVFLSLLVGSGFVSAQHIV